MRSTLVTPRRYRPLSIGLRLALAALLLSSATNLERPPVVNRHRVVLDARGRLLSWVVPQSSAYGQVATLAWQFLKNRVPVEANGLKTYLAYSTFDPHTLHGLPYPHHPAGLYAMLVDSALAYYAYSGDEEVIALVRQALDHQLAHGTTPAGWAWPQVPYASSEAGAVVYQGCTQLPGGGCDGREVVEPDKVGELGYGYLQFYQFTGDARYRAAALACADALAGHVQPGDALHSPWPFRVHARTGDEVEAYSANAIGPIKLFDALIALQIGDVPRYAESRQLAWDWLLRYPMQNSAWSGYFEDIAIQHPPPFNRNQYSPLETARYLLQHPEMDPAWQTHVPQLLRLVEDVFGQDTPEERGVQYGARVISEQESYMRKMGSHTARLAAISALWHAKTGDLAARETAFRAFNWATYLCGPDGLVNTESTDREWWFSDGYGDYIRHFLAGMDAVPAWAPQHENHVLGSTSLVTHVRYRPGSIVYTTFDAEAVEVARVTSAPRSVRVAGVALALRTDLAQPGYTIESLEDGGVVLRIRHVQAGPVTIELPTPPAS